VFRLALIALGVTVATLVVLALLPQPERTVPGGTIELTNARVTLYPQADPEAIWHFNADEVDYEPDSGETTLYAIDDAERTVGGETDFTLRSERLTIDAQENLRGDQVEVYLPDADWTLDMRSGGEKPVIIDQAQGKFETPFLDITGADYNSNAQNVRMNFDLTDFESGGENTRNRDSFRDNAE